MADYETPTDADRNNAYSVTVQVDETGATSGTMGVTGTLSLSSTRPKLGAALTATLADPDGVIWEADMSVVDLENGSIGAVTADLFANQGGGAGLQAKWLWYYTPNSRLRLAFTDEIPGSEELTLQIGDVALSLQGGDATYTWG